MTSYENLSLSLTIFCHSGRLFGHIERKDFVVIFLLARPSLDRFGQFINLCCRCRRMAPRLHIGLFWQLPLSIFRQSPEQFSARNPAYRPSNTMRLEIESAAAVPPSAENATVNGTENDALSESQDHLRNGIKAAQSGRRVEARTALLRAAELNPNSENAWLWLASISEYPEELLVFLNNVLDINPENSRALEWRTATNALLAKTLIQRGIDAAEENQKERAAEFFGKALEYDQQSALAWMWMASLSDSNEGKLLYLEKALAIDPENQSANDAYRAARQAITYGHLADAKAAAVAGRNDEARELLKAVLDEAPDSEEAWMLHAHFADNFNDKIASFERVLAINPSNAAAAASLESLRSLVGESPKIEVEAQTVSEPPTFEPGSGDAEASMFEAEFASVEQSNDDLDRPAGVAEAFAAEQDSEVPTEASEPVISESPEPEAEAAEMEMSPEQEMMAVVEKPMFEAAESEVQMGAETQEEVSFGESLDVSEPHVNGEAVVQLDSDSFESVSDAEHSEYEEETAFVEQPAFADEPDFAVDQPAAFDSYENDDEFEEVHFDAIPAPVDVHPFASPDDDESFDPFSTMISMGPIDTPPADHLPEEVAEPVEENSLFETPGDISASFEPDFSQTMFSSATDIFSQDAPAVGDGIPMPAPEYEAAPEEIRTGYDSNVVRNEPAEVSVEQTRTTSSTVACSFCALQNDAQAIACGNCFAVLTISDLDMILANQNADKVIIRSSVEVMERERLTREFSDAELTMLGIGHLNLKNLDTGYNLLLEASKMNPNNFVLSSQVNSLHIRIEQLKEKAETQGPAATGKKILVVDDSPTIRKLISGKLEKCGHDVFCSSDGVEAVKRLEDFRPDLILLDINMPRMDGYQVCKLIRSNETTRDIPVVMISGKDGFFDKVRGRMAGTSGYITKPFGPETLMKVVESYLQSETAQAPAMQADTPVMA